MSSLTSLSVNKGNTRFAPKVKARPRKSAQQQDQQQGESSTEKATQPENLEKTEESAKVPQQELPACQFLEVPTQDGSIPHEGLSPLETLAAVASSASREEEIVAPPVEASSSSSKETEKRIEKPSSTKRKTRTSKKSSVKATPISTPITIPTPGQPSATEHTREASVAIEEESEADNNAGKKKINKRKDYDPEELKTLDDVSHDPAPKDYLDRPMSDFIRDLQTGIVSKTFKEFEIERVKKKKRVEEQTKMSKEDREAALLLEKMEEDARKAEEERKKKEAEERREQELEASVLQETSHAPQVRLINGQIVLDVDSLTVERQDETQQIDTSAMEVVDESSMSRVVNSRTYGKRIHSARWNAIDTEKFYEAISMFGTDFEMISHILPLRTRNQIRLKFNKEEREHPEKIREYLIEKRKPIDLEKLQEITGKEFEEVPDSFSEPITFAD